MGLNDKFMADSLGIGATTPVVPQIVYQSTTQMSEGEADTEIIANLAVPAGSFPPGSAFKVTMAGTKTGTNGTLTVGLYAGSTSVLSIDADADTAVDWVAELWFVAVGPKSQKAFGKLFTLTEDARVDYAAATVDLSSDWVFKPVMANEHASDEITCEVCIIEYWQKG